METADSTFCSALPAQHQWCRRPVHPNRQALEKERAGGGLGGELWLESSARRRLKWVCTSLDLPVLEAGWGTGADATACLNLQSCQCSGWKKLVFLWYFLWIFMVFSWAAGKKNYKNKNPSGLLGEGVREAVHTLSCHADAMCLSWFIFRKELCCHCRKWLIGRVGDRTSSGNIKLFLCCGRWVATVRSVCTANCSKLQIECNIFRSS